uniref:mRNA interferase MazF n=1 Tax=Candidatus Kentrum sp. FW TaxID=2126338 RepID=A0A450T2R2_9GAMM|nr:MAG: mRNA interferase MazF [Candidatus Kentron sp. FW]
MKNYLKNDLIIVRYPFSDASRSKIRPAIIISASHISEDVFVVPLTSRTISLLPGEFVLEDWAEAGLNVETAVKRGIYTVNRKLIIKKVGVTSIFDAERLGRSLRNWLGF